MPVIDADTHVVEWAQTWDYLAAGERDYQPFAVNAISPVERSFWILGSQRLPRPNVTREELEVKSTEGALGLGVTPGARHMTDVATRLRHMDELGVDLQVIYPTFFLRAIFERPEVELALCRAYNRWLADVSADSHGRLRWAAVAPLSQMDRAVEELTFAAAHGACAVVMRGTELNRVLCDQYFYPLYARAEELGLAIAVHFGSSNALDGNTLWDAGAIMAAVVPVQVAFYAFLSSDVPQRFPGLRFGFLEAGSAWIPYVLQEAMRGAARPQVGKGTTGQAYAQAQPLRDNNLFVACMTDEDLPYILNSAGPDNLVFGTDFGHNDIGSDMDGFRIMRERTDISADVTRRILEDNPNRLYSL